MNWKPDKEIYYRGIKANNNILLGDNLLNATGAKIIVQSNYGHSYYIWAIADKNLIPDDHDVAIWRVKSLKPKV